MWGGGGGKGLKISLGMSKKVYECHRPAITIAFSLVTVKTLFNFTSVYFIKTQNI